MSIAAPLAAQAAPAPSFAIDTPAIIINNNLNATTAPPTGSLDLSGVTVGAATGVNGIGQMTIALSPTSTALLLCTGTLINPRTVIFNAHCVNEQPASSYGANGTAFGPWANGTPIAFGFGANNLPAVRQWFGLASASGANDASLSLLFQTNLNRALYEVEQIWYDPRSVSPTSCTAPGSCFQEAVIA